MAHQHYKGTGQMHSFRGLLADGEQEKIRIEGSVGSIAWRITKFQIIGASPGAATVESTVKIYREQQSATVATVDFTESELLGVAIWHKSTNVAYPLAEHVIFDNQLFVRNIYISLVNTDGSDSCNYYIELEEVKVSAAGMAQLSVAAARRGYVPGT